VHTHPHGQVLPRRQRRGAPKPRSARAQLRGARSPTFSKNPPRLQHRTPHRQARGTLDAIAIAGVCLDQTGIDCKAFATNHTLGNAAQQYALKPMSQQVARTKAAVVTPKFICARRSGNTVVSGAPRTGLLCLFHQLPASRVGLALLDRHLGQPSGAGRHMVMHPNLRELSLRPGRRAPVADRDGVPTVIGARYRRFFPSSIRLCAKSAMFQMSSPTF
jgi:hypothetical protein